MVISTRGIYSEMPETDTEFIYALTKKRDPTMNTRGTGRIIFVRVMENATTTTVTYTWVSGRLVRDMERASISSEKEIGTMETGSMTRKTELEYYTQPMEPSLLER